MIPTMLSRAATVSGRAVALRSSQHGAVARVAALDARAFATESSGSDDKKPQQQQRARKPFNNAGSNGNGNGNGNQRKGGAYNKNTPFGGEQGSKGDARSERKFSFALKGGARKPQDGSAPPQQRRANYGDNSNNAPSQHRKKKFSFAPSVKAKEKEPELEQFDAPAYWNDDFPVEFDDSMKHEVEKLEIFADFTMLLDSSWQSQIHERFDGSQIELIVNAPLEDFNEKLFIDDKNTYDTKVVMQVPLACFTGLSPAGLDFVKQLAGPRYNANKKSLKLTEDRYATRVHNHKRLCDILRELTETAHALSLENEVQVEN